jgi:hypothetical protein
MDEGRKRVIGIMEAILASLHMHTADDLFGTPEGSPRTDKLIDASIQWARRLMKRIDMVCESRNEERPRVEMRSLFVVTRGTPVYFV